MGWDFLGHVDIPHTPFTAFGEWQQFLPNTRVGHNPLDFERYDLGVQWLINKYLRIAVDTQAIQYYQKQFTYGEPFGPGVDKADSCAGRGALGHPRIHAAPGVQILVTAY